MAWISLKNVTTIFMGNHKADNYHDMVADIAQSYKAMGCNMSFKVHLFSLRILPRKYWGIER
jgi:hypothetical protein